MLFGLNFPSLFFRKVSFRGECFGFLCSNGRLPSSLGRIPEALLWSRCGDSGLLLSD